MKSYRVPFVDAKAHYARIKPEIDAAILGCLERGQLIYRQELKDFDPLLQRRPSNHTLPIGRPIARVLISLLHADTPT